MDKKESIFSKLESVKNLPTLPAVIQELGKAIRNPNSDAKRIAGIIEDDPAIMARVLKVVNSAFYMGSEPITSVRMAVARVGMAALNNIALSTSVFSAMGTGAVGGFDRNQFWRHSICTGIGAGVVFEKARAKLSRRFSKDLLHLAGLLHDIGKIVLDQYFHEEFKQALEMSIREQMPLCEAEKTILGLDHAEVGAWLGVKWNLDENLLHVIRWHHHPDGGDEKLWESAALIHMANHICNTEKIGDGGSAVSTFLPGVWKRLGLGISDISDVVDSVREESQKSEVLMALAGK